MPRSGNPVRTEAPRGGCGIVSRRRGNGRRVWIRTRSGQSLRTDIPRRGSGTVGRRCRRSLRVRGRGGHTGRLRRCRGREVGLGVRGAVLPGRRRRSILARGGRGDGREQRRHTIRLHTVTRSRSTVRPEHRGLAIRLPPVTRSRRTVGPEHRRLGNRVHTRTSPGVARRTRRRNTRTRRTRSLAHRTHTRSGTRAFTRRTRTRIHPRTGAPSRTRNRTRTGTRTGPRRRPFPRSAKLHRSRRRGEPVVDGVPRGRRARVVRGVVVQLAPPVVLVTGRRSPLLAHAPNCPPRRPVGNGASGKSDVSRSSNGVSATYRTPIRHRAAGRSHPPRENRPATTWVTRPRLLARERTA